MTWYLLKTKRRWDMDARASSLIRVYKFILDKPLLSRQPKIWQKTNAYQIHFDGSLKDDKRLIHIKFILTAVLLKRLADYFSIMNDLIEQFFCIIAKDHLSVFNPLTDPQIKRCDNFKTLHEVANFSDKCVSKLAVLAREWIWLYVGINC